MSKEARRIPKFLVVAGGFFVAVLAIAGISYSLTDIPQAAGQYRKNADLARRAGLVMSQQDFVQRLEVPADQNGGALMKEVTQEYVKRYEKAQFFGTNPGAQVMNAKLVRDAYTEFEPFWKKLDLAATKPVVIFPKDRSNLMTVQFDEFSHLKYLAKLCSYRVELAVKENQPEVARTAWVRSAQVSLMADDEPILIGTLVRIACSAITTESIRKGLTVHGADPRWRAAARDALRVLDQPIDFAKCLSFEHGFAVSGLEIAFKDPSTLLSTTDTFEKLKISMGAKIPGLKVATLSRIHEGYARFVTEVGEDPYDLEKIKIASNHMETFADQKGLSFIYASIVLPVFGQAGQAVGKEYACRNVLMQALKFYENPGLTDLPLTGRYKMDSDGKPLRLILKKGSLIVYSIGPNLTDDGGVIVRPKSGRNFDFGLEIKR